ncbi:hypothetical protein BC374_05210 [Ensifer sp. LC13]|nr:hypothetical protein BC362_24185 [Ensifer sp. LC14]OCP05864.1 hypothetical protein BBX50_05150 [Ensifer sp. LC11]OCP06613.1 hypothetical protein BC374_05210 [Ensifer sp. LC13]OCP31147.1 hypothetical protein BC364_04885 [Ensifer sp. LC499]
MFYLGGMTLGYLAPPPPKATKAIRQPRTEVEPTTADNAACEESDRDQEWARAFLTPWHLLY